MVYAKRMSALQKFNVTFGQWSSQGNYTPDPHRSQYITAMLFSLLSGKVKTSLSKISSAIRAEIQENASLKVYFIGNISPFSHISWWDDSDPVRYSS